MEMRTKLNPAGNAVNDMSRWAVMENISPLKDPSGNVVQIFAR